MELFLISQLAFCRNFPPHFLTVFSVQETSYINGSIWVSKCEGFFCIIWYFLLLLSFSSSCRSPLSIRFSVYRISACSTLSSKALYIPIIVSLAAVLLALFPVATQVVPYSANMTKPFKSAFLEGIPNCSDSQILSDLLISYSITSGFSCNFPEVLIYIKFYNSRTHYSPIRGIQLIFS